MHLFSNFTFSKHATIYNMFLFSQTTFYSHISQDLQVLLTDPPFISYLFIVKPIIFNCQTCRKTILNHGKTIHSIVMQDPNQRRRKIHSKLESTKKPEIVIKKSTLIPFTMKKLTRSHISS